MRILLLVLMMAASAGAQTKPLIGDTVVIQNWEWMTISNPDWTNWPESFGATCGVESGNVVRIIGHCGDKVFAELIDGDGGGTACDIGALFIVENRTWLRWKHEQRKSEKKEIERQERDVAARLSLEADRQRVRDCLNKLQPPVQVVGKHAYPVFNHIHGPPPVVTQTVFVTQSCGRVHCDVIGGSTYLQRPQEDMAYTAVRTNGRWGPGERVANALGKPMTIVGATEYNPHPPYDTISQGNPITHGGTNCKHTYFFYTHGGHFSEADLLACEVCNQRCAKCGAQSGIVINRPALGVGLSNRAHETVYDKNPALIECPHTECIGYAGNWKCQRCGLKLESRSIYSPAPDSP